MYAQHLDEVTDDIVVVQLFVQEMEFHEEVEHVDDVEKNLQNEWVILGVAVEFQEVNTRRQDVIILLVLLDELVVVKFLDNQQNYLHEVEEAEILLSFVISQQDKLHYVLQVISMGHVLDILEMGQDFHQLVPNRVGKVLGILDVVYLEQLIRHFSINLIEILRDQELNDKHILLHVPRPGLLLLVEVLLRGSYQPLAEGLNPRLHPLRVQLLRNRVVTNDDIHNDNGQLVFVLRVLVVVQELVRVSDDLLTFGHLDENVRLLLM